MLDCSQQIHIYSSVLEPRLPKEKSIIYKHKPKLSCNLIYRNKIIFTRKENYKYYTADNPYNLYTKQFFSVLFFQSDAKISQILD